MHSSDNSKIVEQDLSSVPDNTKPAMVLDTSAFFLSIPLIAQLYTVPRVEGELKDLRGKARLAVLLDEGMEMKTPERKYLQEVQTAAKKTGDASVLSETDVDLLALACEVKGTLVTDDFAIQNTAKILGIPVRSLIQRESEARIWRLRCTGCGKYFDQVPTKTGECPICGSELKRKHK